GDDARALGHYEAMLALDVDYPNVRTRVERLRAARGLGAPSAGETIAGPDVVGVQAGSRYRLVRELGRGATGVVYLARDVELERDVAIKLLHPHLAGTERADALARFFHEARVMASLRHPNVVAVLDLDEASRRIVMELAAGAVRPEAVGTLAYMAPEQRRGEVSPAADVYASAVVLYEMFTGHTPWARDAVIAAARRADDFRLPASVLASTPALADEIQH